LSEISLKDEGIISMNTYPNPSKERVQISYKSKNDSELMVQVTDLMGRTYLQKVSLVKTGDNELNYDIKELPRGSYIIRAIQSTNNAQPKQFSKVLVIEE
jgi:ribosomal protein S6